MYDNIQCQLDTIRKILIEYEYTSGYYQRLAEGYGFIHAPRKKLVFGNPITELLLDFFADNRALGLDEINIIFPNNLKEIHYMSPKTIKSKIGVEPKHIPTFLSLTEGAKSSNLTKLQAIRLMK